MKVLLVYSTVDGGSSGKPLGTLANIHIGLSYVSSMLRSYNHSTRLLVVCSEREREARELAEDVIKECDPEIIAFTAVSTQYPFIARLARYVRRLRSRAFLIIGGCHVSLNPALAISDVFDAVCLGEGEYPVAELANQLGRGQKPRDVQNLWLKRPDGTVQENPVRPFIQGLDALPLPDREMWLSWTKEDIGTHQVVLLGRGCPFNCTYCSNHALRRLADGQYVRFRSPRDILREIRHLRERFPAVEDIYLQAETIGLDWDWLFDLCGQLRDFNATLKTPIVYACNYRVAAKYLDARVFAALREANVRTIEIGLESGSERIRREVLRRTYSNSEFLRAVSFARAHGMRVHVYNMIGFPGESWREYMETVRLNHVANPDLSYTSIFFPYPGTDLYKACLSQGLVEAADMEESLERRRATLDLPGFRRAGIQRAYDWFEFRVYQGSKPLHFRLRKVIGHKVGANSFAHSIFRKLDPLWRWVRQRIGG